MVAGDEVKKQIPIHRAIESILHTLDELYREHLVPESIWEFRDLPKPPSPVIEGKDDKEVMAKASEHAKNEHNMPTIPPEVATKVQKAIHAK